MRRLQTFAVLFTSLAIVGLLAAACDSGTQEPAASAADSIEIGNDAGSNGAANSATPVFEASRYPGELPEGIAAAVPDIFPSDVPIYPGSAPAQGKGFDVDGVRTSAVQLLTMDPAKKVYAYYFDQLESNGWTIDDSEDARARNAITATKGACETSMVISPTEDGGSDIFLMTTC